MTDRKRFISFALAVSLWRIGGLAKGGTAGYIDTIAGSVPTTGAIGASVALDLIEGVTVDINGTVYFSTVNGHQVWKLNSNGTLALVAGTGIDDAWEYGENGGAGDGGYATSASLHNPAGMRFDSHGDLYIADIGDPRIRKMDHATGIITTVAGTGRLGYSGDGGPATSAQLNYPDDVAFDSSDNLYITDPYNYRIRRMDHLTGIITTVAGTGDQGFSGDGSSATLAHLSYSFGIAVDSKDNLYIADSYNHRIRKVDHLTGIITTVAGVAAAGYSGDGLVATSAQLFTPNGVAFDSSDNMYIADSNNNRIRKVDHQTGVITTVAGTGEKGDSGDGGIATVARLNIPRNISLDADENLYIADSNNYRLRKVDASTGVISTVAGNGFERFNGDGGTAIATQLYFPEDIAFDSSGNLYVTDSFNNRIRKADRWSGEISTVAGTGTGERGGYSGDGGAATSAQLYQPSGLAFDTNDDLYFADSFNSRIRKVDYATGIITTVAGTGAVDYSGDGSIATSAPLENIYNIILDANHDLIFSDFTYPRVRKVDHITGILTTIAGTGESGYSGDGGSATAAMLCGPNGLAFDSSGDLYVTDCGRIRMIDSSTKVISTIAGTSELGFSGDGGAATYAMLCGPNSLAFDSRGDLYVTDCNRIRKVDSATGIITTVAGTDEIGFSGDGGAATYARFNYPRGLQFDTDGNLYITDASNHRIRIIYRAGPDKASPAISIAYGADYLGSGVSYFRIAHQDRGSGFGSLSLDGAKNISSPIYQEKIGDATFASGASASTTNPIHLYLFKSDGASPASFSFSASDKAGNAGAPSGAALLPFSATGTLSHTFATVRKAQGVVSILANGGGLRSVVATANGEKVTVGDVPAGEVRTVDLRTRLKDGSDNAIEIEAEGDAGSEACVLVSSATLSKVDEAEESGKRVFSRGDVNEDGRVDVRDGTILLRTLTGLMKATAEERALGDANLDGRLDISDAVALLRMIVGG